MVEERRSRAGAFMETLKRSQAEEFMGFVMSCISSPCSLGLVVIGSGLGIYLGGFVSPLVEFLGEKERVLELVLLISLEAYLGFPLVKFHIKDNERERGIDDLTWIIVALLLGPYAATFVKFLRANKSALALVLGISFGVNLGGCVSRLAAFLKEMKWWRIDGNESKAGTWIMDTGAQCHATGDLRLFSRLNMTEHGSWVYGVSGHEHLLPIRGFGTVQFANFTLENVFYVEGLGRNLISLSKFTETFGYSIRFDNKAMYIKEVATGRQICEGQFFEGLYELESVPVAR